MAEHLASDYILGTMGDAMAVTWRSVDIENRIRSMIDVVPDAAVLRKMAVAIAKRAPDNITEVHMCRAAAATIEDGGTAVPDTVIAGLLREMGQRAEQAGHSVGVVYMTAAEQFGEHTQPVEEPRKG